MADALAVDERRQRRGKLLQLEHAFERHGCMRVEFKTDARNERSRRALEALPAVFEGVFRKHMLVGDDRTTLRDSAYYSITDDEWPAVKANLLRSARPMREVGEGVFRLEATAGTVNVFLVHAETAVLVDTGTERQGRARGRGATG